MNPSLAPRAALVILLDNTFAVANDRPPTYLEDSVQGWAMRTDTPYSSDGAGHAKVCELMGADFIYKSTTEVAFQAGKFDIGQSVEYRVNSARLYISAMATRNTNARSKAPKPPGSSRKSLAVNRPT
jgi:hypothetical protein